MEWADKADLPTGEATREFFARLERAGKRATSAQTLDHPDRTGRMNSHNEQLLQDLLAEQRLTNQLLSNMLDRLTESVMRDVNRHDRLRKNP